MKIGFSTIFSYRPHVEQVFYLSQQLKKEGHEVFFLNCKGSLPTCYTQEIRPQNSKMKECIKCQIGSLYSYTKENTTFIDAKLQADLPDDVLYKLTKSSSFTLTRIEDPKDVLSDEVTSLQRKFHPTINIVYENAKKWIKENKLEFVFFFNGRMDATNALKQACADSGIKFTSVERPIFAHGLQFNFNENCLSLRAINELHSKYIDKPLTEHQAKLAASMVTSRFRREANLEWRSFNKDSINEKWPTKGSGQKILIMPSSRNEVWSEHDWRNDWVEYPKIFDKVIEKISKEYGGDYSNCILRAHPIWSQKLGGQDGSKIVTYYEKWCKDKGVLFIGPESRTSSSNLMQQADFLILNGSSSAYESCILGVPTISTARSGYKNANISQVILCEEDLEKFNPKELKNQDKKEQMRSTLRFIYSYFVRYAIFNSDIRATEVHNFSYAKNIDVKRLEKMMETGTLIPDDETYAENQKDEDSIIELISKKDWKGLEYSPSIKTNHLSKLRRRGLYIFVDSIRGYFKRGDL